MALQARIELLEAQVAGLQAEVRELKWSRGLPLAEQLQGPRAHGKFFPTARRERAVSAEEEEDPVDGVPAEQEETGGLRDYLLVGEEGPDYDYVVGVLTFPIGPDGRAATCEVIALTELGIKCLVAVPSAVWRKRPPKRVLPRTALLKTAALEVAACGQDDRRAPVAAEKLRLWVGLLDPKLEGSVDYMTSGADYPFGVDAHGLPLLPHAQALQQAVNEQFAFQSAESGVPEVEPMAVFGDRLATLEDAMSKIASGFKVMMERQAAVTPEPEPQQQAAPFVAARAKVKPAGQRKVEPKPAGQRGATFPNLDPGVARAAQEAGVEADALAEMDRLVAAAPRAPGLPRKPAAPAGHGGMGLSESEDDGEEPAAEPHREGEAATTDPLSAVLQRLTQVVETLAQDKKPASGQSRLDALLDGASASSTAASGEGGGIPRRNAAARRALRQALVDNPKLISKTIASHMAEDLLGVSQPGVPPLTSARSWVEHRSRIGPYHTLAKTAWATAGALDAIRNGRIEETEARLSILLLMLDQVGVDKGGWSLASELSLEAPVPMHSFRLHEVKDHEQVHSRLLDSRWAELALGHLRDQMDFVEKREKLSRQRGGGGGGAEPEEEGDSGNRPRPKPKVKPQPKK
ncbi:hypothetical protein AK812_SmicGene31352 [Symbiodinium microadriaticum]|uniref:Uncharacterized protein n=1 Tax=Symbiodinium microadriaticum TaxID=2951 RepID=A0A1Q9CWZ9_SYMMI|nr:hypothetical protein AK812_SmicGene31352 [Symbiodinium microadriaticum]